MFAFDVLFWPICVYKPVLLFVPFTQTLSHTFSRQSLPHDVCHRSVPIYMYNVKCIFDTRTSHGTNTFQYNFNLIFDYLFIYFFGRNNCKRTHTHTGVFILFYRISVYIALYSVRWTHTVTIIGLFKAYLRINGAL